jgi:hypothetical protein
MISLLHHLAAFSASQTALLIVQIGEKFNFLASAFSMMAMLGA